MRIQGKIRKELARGWRGYLAAVGLVVVATWLKYLAQPDIIPANVPILYLFAIVPTAVFFGLGPSMLVCVLSVLAFDYYFIPPLYTIGPRRIDEVPILAIFLGVGVIMSIIASDLRVKKEIAEKEVENRKKAEAELKIYQGHLQDLVNQRTADLEKANLNLRESEERWATTLGSIGDGVIATDISGKVTFMNAVAEQLTGWVLSEAATKPIGEVFNIVNEHTREKVESPADKVLQEGVMLIRKDGAEVAIDDSGSPIKTRDGQISGVVLVFHDITERKKIEENLKRINSELTVSNKELESFSYTVSHDLRAPLRSMDGYSQALLEECSGGLDDEGKKWLKNIRESSQYMGRLIDDILSLTRVVRTEITMEKIDLSGLAGSLADRLKENEPERQVEFVIQAGVEAFGDKNLLNLVMQNLLGNAFKFTSKKLNARIEFGEKLKEGRKVYYVKDNGRGFEMEYVDKLFKPFQRLHSEKEFPGTGIGLVTVQRIIQRHGGKVWAEGEPGKGAAFYFELEEAPGIEGSGSKRR